MVKKVLYTTSTHYLLESYNDREITYYVVETNNSMEFELISTSLDEAMAYIMAIRKSN